MRCKLLLLTSDQVVSVEEVGVDSNRELEHSLTCYVDSREEKRCELEVQLEVLAWDNKILILTFSNQTSNNSVSAGGILKEEPIKEPPKYTPTIFGYIPRGPMMPSGSAASILPYTRPVGGKRILAANTWQESLKSLKQKFKDLVVRTEEAQLILTSHNY